MQSLLILGRQPALGLAELESLYGGDKVRLATAQVVVCDVPARDINFGRLGGSIKLAEIITELPSARWPDIERQLLQKLPKQLTTSGGKITLGLSAFDLSIRPAQLHATALKLKKAIRSANNTSVRIIPNKEPALSSAQIWHNQLLSKNGYEIIVVRDGHKSLLAITRDEQDIANYTVRDRERPKRDARVGMLPPKLAQIILNLSLSTQNPTEATVLDPFCGTGVVLQEAALLGASLYGTDIEPRMVDYTRQNLDWLDNRFDLANFDVRVEPGDATDHTWQPPITAIACETYLGRPFTTFPGDETLSSVRHTADQIIGKFLKNLSTQIPSGTRLCLAIPAWQRANKSFVRLPLLDQIDQLGYNRVSFEHTQPEELIYAREGQIVGRELLVITRK